MAILKIKQIVEDLERDTSLQVGTINKAMAGAMSGTAAVATTAVAAGTAAYSGTSYTFSAAQLRGLFNRITGTAGELALCGTGVGTAGDTACWGASILKPIKVIINGRTGTVGTAAQLNPPGNEKTGETKRGTQAAATFVKYLISSGFGSSGTITAGPEGASSTAAKLPDVPANHVALGFIEIQAHATNPTKWYDGGNGTFHPFTGDVNSTAGTAIVNGAAVAAAQD
ncbi:MAG: hypothetical protein EHM36_05455, partial [Deltaproteobacteria bacterium]